MEMRLIADTIYDIEGTVSFLNNVQSGSLDAGRKPKR